MPLRARQQQNWAGEIGAEDPFKQSTSRKCGLYPPIRLTEQTLLRPDLLRQLFLPDPYRP